MLVSIRPEYQTFVKSGCERRPSRPTSLSGHNTGDSRSRTPTSASNAESAIEAFDITDLSRSETAREEGRCDIQFVQCLRGFDDKRNEALPPPSLASILSPKPQETPAHCPPPFHALRLFSMPFLPQPLSGRFGMAFRK